MIPTLAFHIGFLEIKWADILDIALVSVLLFSVYKLVKGTVALRVLLGLLILYLVFLIVQATQMEILTLILDKFMSVGIIAALIIFQQEIRKFLLILGKSADIQGLHLPAIFRRRGRHENEFDLHDLLEAMKTMGSTHTGALIVLSRNDELDTYCETGDLIDAVVSKRLIVAIFSKNSPLHDGAMIIVGGRIKAARCILPVTDNRNVPPNMGLRHRAAIGMSEATDTLVLVVSEETGHASAVRSGKILPALNLVELRQQIQRYLYPNEEEEE
ncbi:MAG: diadenylate cyclase CdaA [Cytophagales bacterium]|nr:diadenylate cyclase CdaA [Bernardetiaceae bacterium]MDW8203703.1 diadenylate cyclase CdaA [Cytophagales bacterium]